MRDHVRFFLNGRPEIVRGSSAFRTFSEFLREERGLVGTKVVCAEGDCGACTILVGRPEGDRLRYRPIDGCIQFVHQLDGSHVRTVESLQRNGDLHPVQQALVDGHGSQCGYCTPGFVMALAGWAEDNRRCADARQALTGNLCRCTGYVPILEAAGRLAELPPEAIAPWRDPPGLAAAVAELARDELSIETGGRMLCVPTDLAAAIAFKGAHPKAAIVAGATELGVLRNKRDIESAALLGLARIPELNRLDVSQTGFQIGANVTWSQMEERVLPRLPQFRRIVGRFGSPQIRNVATLVGNVANGSPIADGLPLLLVMDAELEIAGPNGTRTRSINGFYTGYKQKDLAENEIITQIALPAPKAGEFLRLYKVSRRTDLDIATFGAAIRIAMKGDAIGFAAIAYSGVAATVVRLTETERYLVGRPMTRATFSEAGRRARREVQPIADVRGSSDFRLQLCENVPIKFLLDEQTPVARAAQ